jgi:two-component system cell cycle response regulator
MTTSLAVDPDELTVPSNPQRVLLVDDSAVVRRFVGAHLRRAGYVVDEAKDGAEALESYRSQPVQVVITDVGMPRLGGLELLAALREHAAPPEVILLTGSHATDAQAAVQALRLGAYDYIAKDSAAGEALALAVARASEKWQLRDDNARLMRELRQLSLTDGLTTLGNRRAFDEALRQEVARAQRNGGDLTLVMIDIDHFKRINDTLGHPAGDEILVSFAQRLLAVARSSDRVFRYGGEEFALLLGDTDVVGAVALAQRALAAVADSPMTAGHRSWRLTCSAGLAELASSDRSHDALLKRADAALYDAKRQGRNRVIVASRPPVRLDRPKVVGLAGELVEVTC